MYFGLLVKIDPSQWRDAISETPSTRRHILGSDHCDRTNTNANTNGKWRVTRHRHLRLINATPAATIRWGGAHENAAERSLCPDPERADRTSRNDGTTMRTTVVPKPVQGVQLCAPSTRTPSLNRLAWWKRKHVRETDSLFPRKHRLRW